MQRVSFREGYLLCGRVRVRRQLLPLLGAEGLPDAARRRRPREDRGPPPRQVHGEGPPRLGLHQGPRQRRARPQGRRHPRGRLRRPRGQDRVQRAHQRVVHRAPVHRL